MRRSSGHRRRRLAVAILAISFGLGSCDRLVDPPLPPDAEQFTPAAVFGTWWQMTEACSGAPGSMDAVTWFKTEGPIRDPRTGEELVGYWSAASNRILLSTAVMRDGPSVRHEMLHALLRQPGHPRAEFLGRCAGTVSCASACVRDAGAYPAPPQTPIVMGADSIDIAVDIVPQNPTPSHDDGFFVIAVSAHNLSSHWATFGASPQDAGETFRFEVQGVNGGRSDVETASDLSQTVFAPGETKRQIFDFVIGDDAFSNQLPAGDYTVRGGFSAYWSRQRAFSIGP